MEDPAIREAARGFGRGLVEGILGSLGKPFSSLWTRWQRRRGNLPNVTYWTDLPPSIGADLAGRKDDLKKLRKAVRQRGTVILSGPPGSGKSRLAAEHVHKSKAKGLWTPFSETVDQTLAALAPAFTDLPPGLAPADLPYAVRNRLRALPRQTLWVVDNLSSL